MSKPTAGVQEVQRRRWDKDEYERRAAARREGLEHLATDGEWHGKDRADKLAAAEELIGNQARSEVDADADKLQEKSISVLSAGPNAQGPAMSKRAWLKKRDFDVSVDNRIGKRSIITAGAVGVHGGGFYCPVTKVTLKDSQSYLDHINGRKYQKALGYGMRAERSTASDVRSKLKSLQEPKAGLATAAPAESAKERRKRKREQQKAEKARDNGLGGMMDAESIAQQMGLAMSQQGSTHPQVAGQPANAASMQSLANFELDSEPAAKRPRVGPSTQGSQANPGQLGAGPWVAEGKFAGLDEVPEAAIDWELARAMGVEVGSLGMEP